jgi:hypothetical protein
MIFLFLIHLTLNQPTKELFPFPSKSHFLRNLGETRNIIYTTLLYYLRICKNNHHTEILINLFCTI